MKSTMRAVLFTTTTLLLASCGRQDAAAPTAPAAPPAGPTVFEAMTATIIPQSNLIWELAGNLYDDKGELNAKQLTDAQWQQLKDAATAMGASAKAMAGASGLKAAPPGVKIQNEGTANAFGAAEVQKAMDADPQGFAEHARKLVAIADEIVAAAGAHDAKKTDEAGARLSEVCGACHAKYWYPNQPQ
jgi:hypothetical protein